MFVAKKVFKGRAALLPNLGFTAPLTRLVPRNKHAERARVYHSASLALQRDHNTTATMASTNGASNEKSYFEQQRELLVGDVAASLENVLQNMNMLNRSLEGVIAVCSIPQYRHSHIADQ